MPSMADQMLVEDVLDLQLVDQEIRALARKKFKGIKGVPWRKVALVSGVGFAVAAAPPLLLA